MFTLIQRYAKATGAVLVATAAAVVSALTDDVLSAQEVIVILGITVSAVGVSIVPNLNDGIARYAKGFVSFLMAGLSVIAVLIVGGLTLAEVLTALIAAAAAVGVVVAVPNVDVYGQHAAEFGGGPTLAGDPGL